MCQTIGESRLEPTETAASKIVTIPQSSTGSFQINVKGKVAAVPSVKIGSITVIVKGKWLKTASIFDEELFDTHPVTDPKQIIAQLRRTGLNADIFTFSQQLTESNLRQGYFYDWDNYAVIAVTSYEDWWKAVPYMIQKAVRKAAKSGVVVREVPFDDGFVRAVQAIYDEIPVRQGRSFWHYKKSFDKVKAENSTYADTNIFLGAYLGEELIGFVRITPAGTVAHFLQILSKQAHQGKRPTNALLAKAVEVCAQRHFSHLVYGNYVYHDRNSSLTEFKRRNGFQQVMVPRYYVPLTIRGKLALKLKLYRGTMHFLPQAVAALLRSWRARFATWVFLPTKEPRS